MDSGGISELVACQKRAACAGAEIRLINPCGREYVQLQLVMLSDWFHTFKREQEALS